MDKISKKLNMDLIRFLGKPLLRNILHSTSLLLLRWEMARKLVFWENKLLWDFSLNYHCSVLYRSTLKWRVLFGLEPINSSSWYGSWNLNIKRNIKVKEIEEFTDLMGLLDNLSLMSQGKIKENRCLTLLVTLANPTLKCLCEEKFLVDIQTLLFSLKRKSSSQFKVLHEHWLNENSSMANSMQLSTIRLQIDLVWYAKMVQNC